MILPSLTSATSSTWHGIIIHFVIFTNFPFTISSSIDLVTLFHFNNLIFINIVVSCIFLLFLTFTCIFCFLSYLISSFFFDKINWMSLLWQAVEIVDGSFLRNLLSTLLTTRWYFPKKSALTRCFPPIKWQMTLPIHLSSSSSGVNNAHQWFFPALLRFFIKRWRFAK